MSNYIFDKQDAYRFAQENGYKVFEKHNELIFTICPYCQNRHRDNMNKFSMNLTTGQFQCKRASCGATGNMITLAHDFNFRLNEETERYYNIRNYNGKFKKFKDSHRITESKDAAIKYLESRGISEAICRKYEITTKNDNENILVFPFKNVAGELKFIKYRNMAFNKSKDSSKEWCEANCMPILFGMNHCQNKEVLVITEGQIDSLSLAECGVENAVSVPLGMNGFTWLPHCWDFLCEFKEIIVFGDCEKGMITLSETIMARFPKKTRVVREQDYQGFKDANDLLRNKGKQAILDAIKNAQYAVNKRIKNMADVRKVNVEDTETIHTGMEKVDEILKGGFKVGSVNLISGPRGEGKSTLASMFTVEALNQGYNAFMYSGELPDFNVRNWIDRQIFGKERMTNAEIDKCGEWYDNRLFIFDNNVIDDETQELTNLLDTIEDAINQKGCKLIVLDNLMTAMEDVKTNEALYLAQSHFVGKLAKISKRYEAIILLVAHPRKSYGEFTNDEVAGSSDITNKVDIVMSYQREKDSKNENYGLDNVRNLIITKNRLTGKLGQITLYYSDESKRIYDKNVFLKKYIGTKEELEFQQVEIDQVPFD